VIGTTAEHRELARLVARFIADRDVRAARRAALEKPSALPPYWHELAKNGWLGLHLPEQWGGSGFGLEELLVVTAGLGRALAAAPMLTTAAASAVLAIRGEPALCAQWLPRLAAGTAIAACVDGGRLYDGAVCRDAGPVVNAGLADVLLVTVGADVCVVDRGAAGVTVIEREHQLDLTRPAATVTITGLDVPATRWMRNAAAPLRIVLALLGAAEAAGAAAACVESAVNYARQRTAFGHLIGEFQAVKHHCASMHIQAELAAAAVWDAGRAAANAVQAGGGLGTDQAEQPEQAEQVAQAVDVAVVSALSALLACSALNIQVHGGIGFTWEHDAHLYYRRAGALRALLDPAAEASARIAHRIEAGATRASGRADAAGSELAADVRATIDEIRALPPDHVVPRLVAAGLLFPELPRPWGIAASATEQLAVDHYLTGLNRIARLDPMTGWIVPIVVPTLVTYGTDDQRRRWIEPTLRGHLRWCQLFSEPGAGSDLASLATRAVRSDGGWIVSGQKVWTSSAVQASMGFALVRTDPTVAKHAGLTCLAVDLGAPGVTVRPLRDMTGDADFNEVFLDDVFVPDGDVIGAPGQGWAVARTALSNERASLASKFQSQYPAALARQARAVLGGSGVAELGRLAALEASIDALNRLAVALVAGGAASSSASAVVKLAGAEHDQAARDFLLRSLGDAALTPDGSEESPVAWWLRVRRVTIAGGTSEILRNVIAERVLGLPRGT
jgi:alkylation response protein AidB-like acyl-CoA dehydrogenase